MGRLGMTETVQADPQENQVRTTVDIARIIDMIPHRYPFLMVDKLIDMVRGESAIGIKNVTINEPFFQGHFPNRPVMPGVLIVEAMAQTAAVLVVETLGVRAEGKIVYFMIVENARFRKPVIPGISCACMSRRNVIAAMCGSSAAWPRSTRSLSPRRPSRR